MAPLFSSYMYILGKPELKIKFTIINFFLATDLNTLITNAILFSFP